MKSLRVILLLFFLSFLLPEGYAETQEIIRVAIITDASKVKLAVRSAYQILALNTNEELFKGRRLWHARVIPTDTGIRIGKLDFKMYGVRVQPARSPAIYLNSRKFRGAIDIIRQPDKKLLVINHLSVEEYVAGVLYHEVAPWWPMEALKAQAIVARTFALYHAKVNADKDYDLLSTTYSQVYGGKTSERGRTSKAVRLTRNKVLTYQNRLFPTFYHATCAGYTENAASLWNINITPLKGRECQFCRRSPHFRWEKKISIRDIERALIEAGFKVGSIESIRIVDRNISGRITDLEIISSGGRVKISGNRFRLAVGPEIIRSTNFDLKIKKRQVNFTGYGWGHGVGMCQWGAFFMARKGFNAEQILGFYYPESKIRDVSEEIESF